MVIRITVAEKKCSIDPVTARAIQRVAMALKPIFGFPAGFAKRILLKRIKNIQLLQNSRTFRALLGLGFSLGSI